MRNPCSLPAKTEHAKEEGSGQCFARPDPDDAGRRRFAAVQGNADERTRTSTGFPPHGPEPCASANSATSAWRDECSRAYLAPGITRLPASRGGGSPKRPRLLALIRLRRMRPEGGVPVRPADPEAGRVVLE